MPSEKNFGVKTTYDLCSLRNIADAAIVVGGILATLKIGYVPTKECTCKEDVTHGGETSVYYHPCDPVHRDSGTTLRSSAVESARSKGKMSGESACDWTVVPLVSGETNSKSV